ncbi:MAG TPA: bifunctional [glutamate--ammonia ligase]-adenylyl-L-tyrosine phosphorylase/[glutamate--ammonia-ligase] adenylyltransferase [Casimicrobiaceae bacterium]|nr:bifunctional [glutamate--ammonia ligase]-adenylyl-L-tyrosine phosphorylase/[glutamate--ammonia-ligase] adenylyltransferase [Casimicrobiaceae bacterium]
MPLDRDLTAALAYSRFATQSLAAHPEDADWLAAHVEAPADVSGVELADAVAAADGERLASALRTLRRRTLLVTLARDLAGRGDLDEVCAAMTALAEAALGAAVATHHAALATIHGEPRDEAGLAQRLVVIGMGKLGGGELNVSSDVDLVFVYPEDGETDGPRAVSNREFFDKLGRRVIGALGDVTAEGFVFRVDMRLRPYGESGPLTVPFGALEQYLITQGRAWERYAWLKARPLTGERHDELQAHIRPFVFRKYLDYDAYEGLRDIHRQIREQVKRRDYAPDLKLGPGGIREIEFIVQALQLVRGGREPALQVRGTQAALAAVATRGLLSEAVVSSLSDAYRFLRNVEHRLQYRDDRQTQTLPTDPAERAALALATGFASAGEFEEALAHHRDAVSAQFDAAFGGAARAELTEPASEPNGELAPLAALWRGDLGDPAAKDTLARAGFDDPAGLVAELSRLRASSRYVALPALSQQRVDDLVPRLLRVAVTERVGAARPQTVFQRLFDLLQSVSRRSAYLALLAEHPPVLPRLAQLMGASSWAADYLTRHPLLLDELLDARVLLASPDWGAWRAELARLMRDHDGDAEGQMDALRHFRQAHAFRLLAQDLAGLLTVERLADHLSALADSILAATLGAVWAQMGGRADAPPRFAIVGYGKLGGKELGYASDLDLVFLHDDSDETAPERYARLAQRIITWLTATTAAGTLYDIDVRLRPDGAAGLMASSLAAFRRYQREQAWTWEHQALTRARFVAGDPAIGAAFEAEREAILRMPRDPARLAAEVVEMRRKMAAGHPNRTALFDVKHDPGGMVDVEFAVQYLVLAHADRHAALTGNLGNIALLRIAGELGLVPPELGLAAADAYREFRRLQHQVRLTGAPHARVEPEPQQGRRAAVAALWSHVFGGARA